MLLLSVLDPAVLMYGYEDLVGPGSRFGDRFEALALHHRVIRDWGQRVGMSHAFLALMYQLPPWTRACREVHQLNDVRLFISQLLQRVSYIEPDSRSGLRLEPEGVVCQHMSADQGEVIDAWKQLLCGCKHHAILTEFEPQIATWKANAAVANTAGLLVTREDGDGEPPTPQHTFTLVWDCDSWAGQLDGLDWWPDLHRCVELHIRIAPGLRDHEKARAQPVRFSWTQRFSDSLERYCQPAVLRRAVVRAVTKRVYGILDSTLCDEAIGNLRRFHVTDFWRVHYREEDDGILLLEFGRHDMATPG